MSNIVIGRNHIGLQQQRGVRPLSLPRQVPQPQGPHRRVQGQPHQEDALHLLLKPQPVPQQTCSRSIRTCRSGRMNIRS